MEYFTVSCLRRGTVFIDGVKLGESRSGDGLRVFGCSPGLHDISLECSIGRRCRIMTQRVMITGTNAILPVQVRFVCDL